LIHHQSPGLTHGPGNIWEVIVMSSNIRVMQSFTSQEPQ
jgi:hypothetical protein